MVQTPRGRAAFVQGRDQQKWEPVLRPTAL
jgi:hypothetical protein